MLPDRVLLLIISLPCVPGTERRPSAELPDRKLLLNSDRPDRC